MSEEGSQTRNTVLRGRAHYAARAWREAFEALLAAEKEAPLDAPDLDRLVWAAALVGDDEAFIAALERLYQVFAEADRGARAARAAFWIGFRLLDLGESGRAMGWLARAERHLEGVPEPCVERGYLLLPTVFRHLEGGDNAQAEVTARQAATFGVRCGDRDLSAIAQSLEGRAVLRQQRIEEGIALLDEVMLTVTSNELSPVVTGLVYCNVIATCVQMHAMDRAREWTEALARWCEEQPQLVTFTGYCLVHRSEILQLSGDWAKAMVEVSEVCERVREKADPEVFGDACYQRGEILRLRGEFGEAEAAYRIASDHGCDPQPGLALLRLAQGRAREAMRTIERVVSITMAPWQRARVLPAYVEISLAVDALDQARAASEELCRIAADFESEILGAMAAHAEGAVLLHEGRAKEAVLRLRRALGVWRRVGAPYLAAKIRMTLAKAYLALGDRDGAEMEVTGARQVFAELGALPDLRALASGEQRKRGSSVELTAREREVLGLLAQGFTNKAIARLLFVSARTVDRHVSNIFAKLDVSSRAAATAHAYEKGLVDS